MNIKVAFWDWNGTLWDDVQQWFIAAKAAYTHANIANDLTLETLRDAFDVPVREVIHTLGAPRNLPQENHDRILKTFVDTLAENEFLAKRREGGAEVLEAFEEAGIQNHLVSNHPRELLQKELDRAGLTSYFGAVCGNDHHNQVYTSGTKEERLKRHLNDADIDASQAVIIADTLEEIRIAQTLGMVSVAITGGYSSAERLKAIKPTYIVDSLYKLPDLIAK